MAKPRFTDREVPITGRFMRKARSSRTGAFLRGVARVLSARTFLDPTPARRRRTAADDMAALRGDWEAIGGDIGAALERAERQFAGSHKTAAR